MLTLAIARRYIDPENIPKEYGGQLDWGYGSPEPNLGPEEKEFLGVDRVVRGPNEYTKEKGYVLLGTGHTDEEIKAGKPRKREQPKVEQPVPAAEEESNGSAAPVEGEAPLEKKMEQLEVDDEGDKELFVDAPEDVKSA